ncbi:MAG: radical SAM/SPASM domain-containing protein [Candidatus Margulisiibacteriota bacterium]
MLLDLMWSATSNCNLRCRHCCRSARPERATPHRADILQVLDHFPAAVGKITLTGGELLADRRYAYWLLGEISQRRADGRLAVGEIELQTNGKIFFDERQDKVNAILRRLTDLGVSAFDVSGTGGYHLEQYPGFGIGEMSSLSDLSIASRLLVDGIGEKLARGGVETHAWLFDSSSGTLKFTHYSANERGTALAMVRSNGRFDQVVPLGAGRDLPAHVRKTTLCNVIKILKSMREEEMPLTLFVDYIGDVYLCYYGAMKIGNIQNMPLEKVLQQAKYAGPAGRIIQFYEELEKARLGNVPLPPLPPVPCHICGPHN